MQNGVKYYSILEASGYGLAALAYIESLLALGVSVYWTPLVAGDAGYQPWTWLQDARKQVAALVEACIDDKARADVLLQCLNPIESYQCIVMHTVPEYWPRLIEPGGYHIGYTVWETNHLPSHFPALINQVDKVLVPCHFNRTVFEASGVRIPIEVVPHILGIPGQSPVAQRIPAVQVDADPHKRYVFYSINVWSARKAMWTLLHCYLRAFSGDDPVELCIKTSLLGPKNEQDRELYSTEILIEEIRQQYANPAKIQLIRGEIAPGEISDLHYRGDCYISTTHSEGWGLGAFEAAGYAKPVIITGWGGQTDYLDKDQSFLIDFELVTVEDQIGSHSYSSNQQWAQVDEQQVIALMHEVYRHPDIVRERAEVLAATLRKRYSAVNIGKKLVKAIFQ